MCTGGQVDPAAVEVIIARIDRRLGEHLTSRRVLRQALLEHYGPEIAQRPVHLGKAGKPFLPGDAPAISIAHAGGWCAIALSADWAVGVDIEPLIDRRRLASVAAFLPARVREQIAFAPPRSRTYMTLRWWVRLEATAKACDVALDHAAGWLDEVQLSDLQTPALVAAVAARAPSALSVTWTSPGNSTQGIAAGLGSEQQRS